MTSRCVAVLSTSSLLLEPYPVRMEFWGDEVESLRSFSVYSQRSLGPLESVRLHAAAEEAEAHAVSIMSLLRRGDAAWCGSTRRWPRAGWRRFQSDLEDVLGEEVEEGWYVDWSQVETGARRVTWR